MTDRVTSSNEWHAEECSSAFLGGRINTAVYPAPPVTPSD